MSVDTQLGIAGLILGLVSFFYAIYQQVTASSLRRYRIKTIRANLKECILVMSQSYKLLIEHKQHNVLDPDALKRIGVIHTTSALLIKSLFRELSEIDKPYDEEKLTQYIAAGLITSKWVWFEAYTFVEHNKKTSCPAELPNDTTDFLAGDLSS